MEGRKDVLAGDPATSKEPAADASRNPRPNGQARSKMRQTMVGIAPAANPPVLAPVDEPTQLGMSADALRSFDTTIAQNGPPAAMVDDGVPPSAPSSAPRTKRMSEAPTVRGASAPPRTSSPSFSSMPPRLGSIPLPSEVRARAPSIAPGAPILARAAPVVVAAATRNVPTTDPMAAPLERKPLVTTSFMNPIAPPAAPAGIPSPQPMRVSVPTPMPPTLGGTVQMATPLAVPTRGSMPPRLPSDRPGSSASLPPPLPGAPPATFVKSPTMRMSSPSMTAPPPMGALSPPPMKAAPPPLPAVLPNALIGPSRPAPAPAPAPRVAFSSEMRQALADGRMPALAPAEETSSLTYQVYTPETLPPPPRSQPSRVSFPEVAAERRRLRLLLALVGGFIVLVTTALVIVGTSSDAPRVSSVPSATAPLTATGALPAAPTAPAVDPPPPTISAVADPPPDPPPASATPTSKKPKPASSLKAVPLPPNPFGGGGSPSLKPPGKRK